MVDECFEVVRIALVLLVCVVRLSMVRPYLQAHLNMAHDRVVALRREPGRITAADLQKLVVRVYFYLCVVALQYLAPLVVLLFTTLMLKTLGDVSVLRVMGYVHSSFVHSHIHLFTGIASDPTLHRHLAPLRTDFTDTRTALQLFSLFQFFF